MLSMHSWPAPMEYDKDKVDDAVLALLFLAMQDGPDGVRAWKGYDWAAMERLHLKGYIEGPRSKAKSVVITEQGKIKATQLFRQIFGKTQ